MGTGQATHQVENGENKHQQRNRASTRAMLEAAAELIVEGGLDAVTLAAVGERSGYSRGLASARFGSKAGMVEALVDLISGRWRERTVKPAQRRATALEAICAFIDAVWRQMEQDDTYLRVLYTLMFEAVGPDQMVRGRVADLQREQIDSFAELFRRGITDGTIRPEIDPEAQALLLVAELRGMAYQWLIDPARTDGVAVFRLVRRIMIDRVATETARVELAELVAVGPAD